MRRGVVYRRCDSLRAGRQPGVKLAAVSHSHQAKKRPLSAVKTEGALVRVRVLEKGRQPGAALSAPTIAIPGTPGNALQLHALT